HGRCGRARAQREDPFIAMVEAIVWQQLSGKAAATIYGRVLDLVPNRPATPAALLAVPRPTLRAAGLSNAKVAYVCDLATQVAQGTVRLDALDSLDDESIL